MPKPECSYGRNVTGNYRVRRGWWGKLVLQIEVYNQDNLSDLATRWIDAIESDLWRLDYSAERKPYQPLRTHRHV